MPLYTNELEWVNCRDEISIWHVILSQATYTLGLFMHSQI